MQNNLSLILVACAIIVLLQIQQTTLSTGQISRCNAAITEVVMPSTPAFDAIIHEAASLIHEEAPITNRKKFDVKTWQHKGTGGLTDSNRVKVAEIYSKANSVFEYGLGESTLIASHVGVPRYSGTDSDPVWIGNTRRNVSSHFRFYLADIGKTGAWGRPEELLNKSPLNYMLAPLMAEPLPFDVYMIDGRWRFSCMLAAFLHAAARGMNNSPTVMVHDCDLRSRYHKADHLLSMEETGELTGNHLCIYKRKTDTTDEQLLDLWMQNYKDFK